MVMSTCSQSQLVKFSSLVSALSLKLWCSTYNSRSIFFSHKELCSQISNNIIYTIHLDFKNKACWQTTVFSELRNSDILLQLDNWRRLAQNNFCRLLLFWNVSTLYFCGSRHQWKTRETSTIFEWFEHLIETVHIWWVLDWSNKTAWLGLGKHQHSVIKRHLCHWPPVTSHMLYT